MSYSLSKAENSIFTTLRQKKKQQFPFIVVANSAILQVK